MYFCMWEGHEFCRAKESTVIGSTVSSPKKVFPVTQRVTFRNRVLRDVISENEFIRVGPNPM